MKTLPNRKITVALLFGGRSGEHEVSIDSAESILAALNPRKYEVLQIGITKEGEWLAGPDMVAYLRSGRGKAKSVSLQPEPRGQKKRWQDQVDVVFPILHGSFGEDGKIQGLLELAGLSYVGSDTLSSAAGMDKEIMRRVFQAHKLPVPLYEAVLKKEWKGKNSSILRHIKKSLQFPVFTKPANLGSSVGIRKCANVSQLAQGLQTAFRYDTKAIVDQGILGRELNCAILGNEDARASEVCEVKTKREFYDYDAKYTDDDTEIIIPARVSKTVRAEVQKLSLSAFHALRCSGLARVEFFLEKKTGKILLNEINTLPGFTSHSMYPRLWNFSGVSFGQLCDELIGYAIKHQAERKSLKFTY
ncbi:MAG: D-alanine--D-alanine ligase family protein [bacterium]|nr:D-alanine--D-alanine ligase family protein [bacterium]